MISDEHGDAVMEQMVVLRAAGLIDGDNVEVSLIASVLTEAMRSNRTPREVSVSLWDIVPSDDDWEVARTKFAEAIDRLEARGL